MSSRTLLVFVLLTPACTSLGPMPGATGASVAPRPSPGLELQVNAVPGYFLSQATQAEGEGASLNQYSAFVEPGKLIGVEGLAIGARHVSGGDDSGHFEPMLRYRHGVTDIFAVGVVGYGTHARDSFDNASYSLTRGGLEVGVDLRAVPKNPYVELHVMGGGSVTGLWAKGRYCHTEEGYGIECEGMPANVKAEVAGAYPSLFVGLALEVANRLGFFHGLRVQTLAATGTMPSVRYGEQRSATSWMALGLGIGVAFGAPDREE